MPTSISRRDYAAMFGPTVGDKVRLADTDLIIEVERDLTAEAAGAASTGGAGDNARLYGEEVKFGGGKVIRDGMGQSQTTRAEGAVDTVITNALIVDHTGIYKADVGIKAGMITGIGKAGNPDVMPNVTPGMVVGVTTEAIAGEGHVLTAGGLDTHVHFICPQIADEAIAAIDLAPDVSLSRETLAAFSNLNALPYRGTYADRIMLYTLRALNYLELGDADRARGELRRAYERQREAVQQNAERL